MAAQAAGRSSELMARAEKSFTEDLRLRTTLLFNEEWRRQMDESHAYFTSGKAGHTLSELGA